MKITIGNSEPAAESILVVDNDASVSSSCNDVVAMGEKLVERGDETRCGSGERKSHLEKEMPEDAEVHQRKQQLLGGEEVNHNDNQAGIVCQFYLGISTYLNFSILRCLRSLLDHHLPPVDCSNRQLMKRTYTVQTVRILT